jgi:hypothetical protein
VRSSEITGFRYRPNFHGIMGWARKGFDPATRFAVEIEPFDERLVKDAWPNLGSTALWKDWNVIENLNVYDGPAGIHVGSNTNHNIVSRCVINVDGDKIKDESKTTVVIPEKP